MKKYRVVFDIDDTLNDLVKTTYKKLNLMKKFHLKKRYYLRDCSELTDAEKKAVEASWYDPATYLDCSAHKGIEKIDKLAEKENVEVNIHSFCTNQETATAKFKWLHTFLNCLKLILKLEVGMKTPIEDVDIVVEDNIEYLCKCMARYKILINISYNQAEAYPELDLRDIIRVDSLDAALDYILNIVENEG